MTDELDVKNHFAFGENWKSFVRLVDEKRIQRAQEGMERLIHPDEIKGRTFLDIGCGSGLSSLVAARLGASRILATDIDPVSVAATSQLLSEKIGNVDVPRNVEVVSVFNLPPEQFDIVYSWGVLHHTGDMWRAIGSAASHVKPGGLLAIAIYGKTRLCPFWKREKALYSKSPSVVQAGIRALYKVYWAGITMMAGNNPWRVIKEYGQRGMNWNHDVHDWLGGYPYESATPGQVREFVRKLRFDLVRENLQPGSRRGLLGAGCDEYVFKRNSAPL